MLDETWNFIKRHTSWIILAIVGLLTFFLIPGMPEEIKLLCQILVVEALAMFLSMAAIYVITRINFIDWSDKDNGDSEIVKAAKIKTIGYMVLAVHMLVGLAVVGYYFVFFNSTIGSNFGSN